MTSREMTSARPSLAAFLERYGLFIAIVFLAVSVAVGATVSLGAGVLVTAGALLLFVVAMGFESVTALLSSDNDTVSTLELQDGEVATLKREKASILQVLRDLEVERDLGKVSATDFETLDRTFRSRAADVMKRIDTDLAAYKQQAESLIAERIAARVPGAPPSPGAAATPAAVVAGSVPEADAAARSCGGCGGGIDDDSVFCKHCGRRVGCSACAAPLDPDSAFCKKCGAKAVADA